MTRQQIQFPLQQRLIVTPSSPPSGSLKLYPKADGNLYKLSSAGVEALVGAPPYVHPDPFTLNNLTVSQVLQIGPSATNRIKNPANAAGHLSVESSTGNAFLAAGAGSHLGGNAYWDGANWMRFSAATGAAYLALGPTNLVYATAPSGANPISAFTTRLSVDSAGSVVLAGPVSGVTSLAMSGALTGVTNITTGAITSTGDWFRIGVADQGIYNSVVGTGIAFNASGPYAYPGGQRLLRTDDYSVGTAGSKLVMRDASGYIVNNYVNLTADIAGGAPAYVAGQNGDNYLRWYPRGALGLPPTLKSQTFTLTTTTNQAWNICTIAGAADGTYLGNQGSYLSVKPGVFHISGTVGGYYSTGFRIYTDGALRVDVNTSQPEFAGGIGGGWCGQVNSSIQFYGRAGVSFSGTVVVTWVPTPSYPS